ncbi:MAG: LD-carboxypeptidase [Bacteroidales bacterium]|jgi:muramoyltetrapeptide carboxypeptidase|nr:LD-carboxypeptidase [Bacteroidales bacterium]
MITPPYLQSGDVIGIAATARRIFPEDVSFAVRILEENGYKILFAPNLFAEQNQYAGSDRQRINDFQYLLDHNDVKAILCARGGYGSVRIIDHIDFSGLQTRPKWICGYSDVTVFHAHLHHQHQISTIHSTMPISMTEDCVENLYSLLKALQGKELRHTINNHPLNRKGVAEGELIGGNLSVLYSLLGSPSDINTNSKILFIEDLDEYLYHIDRMMINLKRNGKLSKLAGLVVGNFTEMHDNTVPYGKTAEEIIAEHVAEYDYPVCFGFPAGHGRENRAVRFGERTKLVVGKSVGIVSNSYSL